MSSVSESAVRRGREPRALREWALVLAAAGIAHRVARDGRGWALLVAADDTPIAAAALDDYDRERPMGSPGSPDVARRASTAAGVVTALLLVGFFLASGDPAAGGGRFAAGAALGERIRQGEWWRAVTALTLHADAAHLAGNLLACLVFVPAVCRALGVGVGVALVLAAGAGGNLLAALVRRPGASSVGFSTAVFGAVGILGSLAYARRLGLPGPRRRPWVGVAASLALLAFLGADLSARTDLTAHLCGLLCGLAAGALGAAMLARPPGATLQRCLAAAAGAVVGLAWLLASSR